MTTPDNNERHGHDDQGLRDAFNAGEILDGAGLPYSIRADRVHAVHESPTRRAIRRAIEKLMKKLPK